MRRHLLIAAAVVGAAAVAAPVAPAQTAEPVIATYTMHFVTLAGHPTRGLTCAADAFACGSGTAAGFGPFTTEFGFDENLPASTAGTAHRAAARPAQRAIRWIAVRKLAHGTLPGKQTFTIIGERYRFQGRLYFSLAISINRPGELPGGGGGAAFNPAQSPGVLAFTAITANACPHSYAVVLGLLRAPSDVVLARRGDITAVLRHVSIPPVLHAHGVLVYARLSDAPNEVIVQRPDGKRQLDDKFHFGGRCSPG